MTITDNTDDGEWSLAPLRHDDDIMEYEKLKGLLSRLHCTLSTTLTLTLDSSLSAIIFCNQF
jgi:hypothetical protein